MCRRRCAVVAERMKELAIVDVAALVLVKSLKEVGDSFWRGHNPGSREKPSHAQTSFAEMYSAILILVQCVEEVKQVRAVLR